MEIADKIVNDMAIKHDGFIMICDSCKHLYTGECDPNCKSLTGFESIAKSLIAELVELRQMKQQQPCDVCSDYKRLLYTKHLNNGMVWVGNEIAKHCPKCGRKLVTE